MGVYIKGINMSEIEELVLTKNVQLIFCWTSDRKITAMTRTESDSGIVSYSKEFDVVEVPEPHGRLIDANVLYSIVDKMEALDIWVSTESANKFKRAIKARPTVIEAEGE